MESLRRSRIENREFFADLLMGLPEWNQRHEDILLNCYNATAQCFNAKTDEALASFLGVTITSVPVQPSVVVPASKTPAELEDWQRELLELADRSRLPEPRDDPPSRYSDSNWTSSRTSLWETMMNWLSGRMLCGGQVAGLKRSGIASSTYLRQFITRFCAETRQIDQACCSAVSPPPLNVL